MKKLLLLLACVALAMTTPASTTEHTDNLPKSVYICTGKSAKVYHYDSDCKGLGNCKASVRKVDLETAIDMGRRPCKICAQ